MGKIYVTRHGETEWNTQRRMQGHMDSALTEMGQNQAKWLGEKLKTTEFSQVYASPSGRTRQTTALVLGERALPITYLDGLREIYLGPWEGKNQEEIEAFDAESYQHFWFEPEKFKGRDAENFTSVIHRAGAILESLANQHPEEDILIVTHAVVLKSMYAYILQKPLVDFWKGPFMNATCLNCFTRTASGWEVLIEADTSHYPEDVEPKWVHPK